MEEMFALPAGDEVATNQVLYNPVHRGIELGLLPWCRNHKMPIMAYSPVGHSSTAQRRMFDRPELKSIATRHDATPAQIILSWILRQDMIVIPKASSAEHIRENRAALDLVLTDEDRIEFDRAFPRPRKKVPL